MNVRPQHQDQNMVHDLTAFENLVGGLFAHDAKQTGHAAVEAVKDLFMGDKTVMGLRQYILSRIPSARRSVSFDKLIAEAKANDAKADIFQKTRSEEIKLAEEQLPQLKVQLERILKDIKDPQERSSWQTEDILEENLKDITEKMRKFSKIMEETSSPKDGGGGPGIHDGAGGIGSFFSGIGEGIKKAAQGVGDFFTGTTRYERPAEPVVPKPTAYNVRGLQVNDDDFAEATAILASEISNRTPDKQKFEVRNVINTAINRAQNNPKYYGDTLTKVLQKPYQYQGYAPGGMTVSGGKQIESQYQKIKAGNLDEPTRLKVELIKEALEEMKSGKFEDTTGGSLFYVHASDGTMWLGSTIKEAKDRATQHERQIGGKLTQWGTAVGLPVTKSN